MSQFPPPPPEGLGPEDFAPIGVPQPPREPPGSRANGWAIASLVSGLLGCVPYATGIVAVVTGIIGLRKANDPRYAGRGLAIGGLLLGGLSVLFWLFFAGAVWSFVGATRVQRQMAQDYVQMLSTGAVDAAAERTSTNVGRGELELLAQQMQGWGAYQDATSYSSSLNYDNGVTTCQLEGSATFAGGEHLFDMTLVKEGETWKVRALRFDP